MNNQHFDRFSGPWVKCLLLFSLLYWLWFGLVVGIDAMAIAFYLLCVGLFFSTSMTRKLGVCFTPLFIYLICYSSLKILHDYNPFPIHNKGLYDMEVKLFGVKLDGLKVSLCEFFNQHVNLLSDIIAGSFYITWAPFPILFGLWAFYKKRRKLVFNFWLAFLTINIFGFIIYIVLPAAPPWYYLKYGAEIIQDLGGEAAGLARFDQLIGFGLYEGMYSQGTNTFGALPSMHAAFPMVLSYYSFRYKNKIFSSIFLISMVSIWFGAIYSNHHYLIDVLMGMSCAIIGIFLTDLLVNGKFAPKWYTKTIDYVSTP